MEEKSRDKIIAFCKHVENRLHSVINYLVKSNKKKSFEAFDLSKSIEEKPVEKKNTVFNEGDGEKAYLNFDKNDVNINNIEKNGQAKQRQFSKTSKLDQCD